jgi:hypothetical protein
MTKMHCRMRLGEVPLHLYQVIAGFELLARRGVIGLEIVRDARHAAREPRLPYNMMEVVLNGEIRLLYDLNDGYDNLVEEPDLLYGPLLRHYDICFKRSFSAARNAQLTHGGKIRPLGLNYMVTIPGSAAHRPMPLDPPKEKLKKLIRMLPATSHYNGWYTVEKFEDEPKPDAPPEILFMARMWDVRGDAGWRLTDAKREERHFINEQRARTIRLCREAFGGLFHGGVAPTPYACEHYPDLVITSRREVARRAYLRRMKRSPICIATMGLHQSIGWKFAEYVAASKAIVTETLHYEVPGVFGENRNYLSFRTPEECVEAVDRLIRDERLRQSLMRNNRNYYRRHVRPDRLVLNSLMAAAGHALPAAGAAQGWM